MKKNERKFFRGARMEAHKAANKVCQLDIQHLWCSLVQQTTANKQQQRKYE